MRKILFIIGIVLFSIPSQGKAYNGNYGFESEMNSIQGELRDIENDLQDIKDILDPSPYIPSPRLEKSGCPLHSRSYTPEEVYGNIDAEILAIRNKALMGRAQRAEQFRDFPPSAQSRLMAEQMGQYTSEIINLQAMKNQRIKDANGKCVCEPGYVADNNKGQCVIEGQVSSYNSPHKYYSPAPNSTEGLNWYTTAVSDFIEVGYLDGSLAFDPDADATRGEFIEIIIKLAGGLLGTSPSTPSFDDVGRSNPYFSYFEEAAIEGWVTGQGNCYGSHPCLADPYGTVNRAEAATLINRAMKIVGTGMAPRFSDNLPNQWYTEAIQTAADNCILQGDAGSSAVRPEATLNRAEMVVMLHRADQGPQYPNCQ